MEAIEEQALDLIRRNTDGVFQSRIWKELGINSRQCSRAIRKLLDEGLVGRESVVTGGVRTYKINYCGEVDTVNKYELMTAGDVFDPCAGCIDDCTPTRCISLNRWIRALDVEL